MKKLFTLFTVMLIASMTFAQVMQNGKIESYVKATTRTLPANWITSHSDKATIDTAGWTLGYQPEFLSPTLQVQAIHMTDSLSNRIGYWFGSNGTAASTTSSDYWAQCWVNTASVKVSGVLFWLAGKTNISSSTNSKITFNVQKVLPYVANQHGCLIGPGSFSDSPGGSVLGTGSMDINTLDTTFTVFNYVPITLTPAIAGDFAVVANFKAIRTNSDTAYMFCDAIGNGLSLNYAQYCINPSSYYYVSTNYPGTDLDINISLFAIVDDGVGVNDMGYFNGLRMSIRQNPVKENAVIDYVLQNSGMAKLVVWDTKGNEVASVNDGMQSSGQHSMNVDISKFKPGLYFCSLTANGGRLTKKLVVGK